MYSRLSKNGQKICTHFLIFKASLSLEDFKRHISPKLNTTSTKFVEKNKWYFSDWNNEDTPEMKTDLLKLERDSSPWRYARSRVNLVSQPHLQSYKTRCRYLFKVIRVYTLTLLQLLTSIDTTNYSWSIVWANQPRLKDVFWQSWLTRVEQVKMC